MNKSYILKEVKTLLEAHDILEGPDYIFSLQGPTVITTIQGTPKITPQIQALLSDLKVLLL